MKKFFKLFQVYPQNPQATNLSIVSGGLRLLTLMMLIGAVLLTLSIIIMGLRALHGVGLSTALWYIVEEMDDQVFAAFFLWCSTAFCWYITIVLRTKARLLGEKQSLPPERI